MEALGRLYDLSAGAATVDLRNATTTGKRVSVRNCEGMTVILQKAVGADDPVIAVNCHNALSGGTTQAFAGIANWYRKSAVSLAGTEVWVKTTQSPISSGFTLTGEGVKQGIYAFPLETKLLPVGFAYVSFSVTVGNTGAQLGSFTYLLHDLDVQRSPASLVAALS